MIPLIQDNPNGFHQKYFVAKMNGQPLEPGAEYFVLRLDAGGDPAHVAACRRAILEYAKVIQSVLPELAEDLTNRYGG